jgi:hypothetical protein
MFAAATRSLNVTTATAVQRRTDVGQKVGDIRFQIIQRDVRIQVFLDHAMHMMIATENVAIIRTLVITLFGGK